jgi:hypothetical protein
MEHRRQGVRLTRDNPTGNIGRHLPSMECSRRPDQRPHIRWPEKVTGAAMTFAAVTEPYRPAQVGGFRRLPLLVDRNNVG